jgi:hypothetical protein
VTHADEAVGHSEHGDDLGRRGQQRGNAHRRLSL